MKNQPLEVPPKTWRNSRQIAAYAGQIRSAITVSKDGAFCDINLATAYALVEICCQAIHTERNHEPVKRND